MYRLYRTPALSEAEASRFRQQGEKRLSLSLPPLVSEWCYYIVSRAPLSSEEEAILRWLVAETFQPNYCSPESFLGHCRTVMEIGPQLNFETPWSSAAVAVCRSCGLTTVSRIERSVRYGLFDIDLTPAQEAEFLEPLYDRMVQVVYPSSPDSFESGKTSDPVRLIPLLEEGETALWRINQELGFGWDQQDVAMIAQLFRDILRRNPTDVELIQIAQANSEHSRHWFFRGQHIIDGAPCQRTLMDIVRAPWQANPNNSLIAFYDDSSAIRGGGILAQFPEQPGQPSLYRLGHRIMHPILTAETHNFPTGVAAYEGAGTGTGGRIRDKHVTGRGALVIAGGAAYCTGNLHIPGYDLPWEQDSWAHPENLKSPLEIMIRASDGASNYGNCFGEPVIYGFIRTFDLLLPDGYRAWFRPIMFTVGSGLIDNQHIRKGKPEPGMLVVQIGGPAYRIGLGGGSASSMIQGQNTATLDYDAVQRPDPQMENRLDRCFKACVALAERNPIVTSHDLGAGGDCNAVPEIVEPAGARINLRAIPVGDQSLSTLVIWGNESQERDVLLIRPAGLDLLRTICEREDLPLAVIGEVTGDGRLVLFDETDQTTPVDLPLAEVLGEIQPKTFVLETIAPAREVLHLPADLTIRQALERVLRLPAVGSKRFLTTKVDRSVSGLIAQQQCVGPNQLTLSDYAVIAHSYAELTSGTALSIGEQPIKGLVSTEAMARLAVAEAILNLSGAVVSGLPNIRCSANWMLAAKLPGEGVWLRRAAEAMRDIMIELGIAVDGGKDSLSMAVKTVGPDGAETIVKAPGELVISAYVDMPDVSRKVTPDFKAAGNVIIFADLAAGCQRLGGSALAQVFSQVGDECPDVEDAQLLKRTFETVQSLVRNGQVISLHDRSDGGLITTVLEMAFAGNTGCRIQLPSGVNPISHLFNEEIGLVLECCDPASLRIALEQAGIPSLVLGVVTDVSERIVIMQDDQALLDESMIELRRVWEETSTQIDRLQANPDCVDQESRVNARLVTSPRYFLTFEPKTRLAPVQSGIRPTVAILREQGSNGDREMAAAFSSVGFEAWDVTMTDLVSGRITLEQFQGIAFVGGFSFADVLDAGKGWAGVIRFNRQVAEQFERFRQRPDTFSLGICNGCQLMALLGWVPGFKLSDARQPRFIRNASRRFESRFATVRVLPSPAIMLQGMAGSILGIWVAHAEGRLHVPDADQLEAILQQHLAPLQFVDEQGEATEEYPLNPNASPQGITALCSEDGRHLAMMPHPERTFLTWQWPWLPDTWRRNLTVSPWLRLFQNAYNWCVQTGH